MFGALKSTTPHLIVDKQVKRAATICHLEFCKG